MSQQMNILHCFSCKMYQVHIVKKAKKWQCKVCNVKQSFRRVFFQGSGKDCRIYVQKLNTMKAHETEGNASFEMGDDANCSSYRNDYSDQYPRSDIVENKWAKYLDTSEQIQCSTSRTSNDMNHSSKENHDSMCLCDDKTEYECSQNDYTNTNPSWENDLKEDFCFDNQNKNDDVIVGKTGDTVPSSNSIGKNNDSHGKDITEIKDAKNIFDDNEDFDLAIDF